MLTTRRTAAALFAAAATFGLALPAQAQTEVRIMWYSDGNEGDVMRDLLDKFEKANPDIKVNLDRVPYKSILEQLPALLDSGQGPDIARVTDLGGLSRHYLDIGPLVKDRKYWQDNFGATNDWMRPAGGAKDGIFGMMTQLTLVLPIVNVTLFQQANVPLPGPKATWEEWAKAATEVAKKVGAPYPIAVDRSGHRIAPLIINYGGKLMDGEKPALVDDGFKKAANMLVDWHKDGTMSKALWGSVGGSTYRGANDEFKNGQVVMYYSGSWQFGQFAKTVGKAFDWQGVPNPCGTAGCTGMPGGAALVPIKTTKNPQAVARVMDFLASEPIHTEFMAKTLFLPAHTGIAAKGVPYQTDDASVKKSLDVAVGEVGKLSPVAFAYQGYAHNRILFNASITRINQVINGEMSMDDAYKRMQADIVEGFAAKGIKIE
ncbi:MAG: ABC transporter substrate-binding protein [Hyphomicrobiales bacterium]|nr:ABC transporter substrate-binding protein [Hyphomicrobiales bacterium]